MAIDKMRGPFALPSWTNGVWSQRNASFQAVSYRLIRHHGFRSYPTPATLSTAQVTNKTTLNNIQTCFVTCHIPSTYPKAEVNESRQSTTLEKRSQQHGEKQSRLWPCIARQKASAKSGPSTQTQNTCSPASILARRSHESQTVFNIESQTI